MFIKSDQQTGLQIVYQGNPLKVTPVAIGTDTFFRVHLPGADIELKLEYIDGNPSWAEDGVVTERSEALGRLIEQRDGAS